MTNVTVPFMLHSKPFIFILKFRFIVVLPTTKVTLSSQVSWSLKQGRSRKCFFSKTRIYKDILGLFLGFEGSYDLYTIDI